MAFVLNGKPLQILGLDDGANQLRLRRRHLESILLHPKAKDRPVAIVSICGDLRKGKSFMLNVLLRYLAWTEAHPEQAVDLIVNPGKQSTTGSQVPDWMGDANEPLTGFGWRPGTVRMTIGVWMWSEPFIVPLRAIQVLFDYFGMRSKFFHLSSQFVHIESQWKVLRNFRKRWQCW